MSTELKYGAIYHHFRKWAEDGSWQRVWQNILSCSGNPNDLFNIQAFFEKLLEMVKQATIEVEGLFLNADAGFDSNIG